MNNKKKFYCLCIPVYNKINYLNRLFNYLEIYVNFIDLILLVDDCSTDGSFEYLNNRIEKLNYITRKKFKLYRFTSNCGEASVRNFILQNTVDNYVFWLDSDDILDVNHFDILKKFNNKESVIYSYSSEILIPNFSNSIKPAKLFRLGSSKMRVNMSNSLIYNNGNLPLFPNLRYGADTIFWMSLMKINYQFICIPINTSEVRPSGNSSNFYNKIKFIYHCIKNGLIITYIKIRIGNLKD